jgi:uncharacterized RDD family membrane protein YckC
MGALMDGVAPASHGPATGSQFDNRRVLAALIDIALLIPVAFAMSAIFGGFTAAAAALTWGWALYYYFAFESDHGQTIGKRVMKIRVMRADGQPLDTGRVAVRTLLRPIDAIGAYLLGLIVMLATGQRRQRIGDLAAGTVITDAGDAPARPEPAQAVAEAPAPEAELPSEPEFPSEPPSILPPPPMDDPGPVADTGLDPSQVPEVRPFEPFSEPASEPVVEHEPADLDSMPPPAPDAALEPEPVVEHEPVVEIEPSVDDIVPVDRPEATEPPADEPVPVEQEPEPEPDPQANGETKPADMEIVTSPIELVMQDDEPEDPQDQPPAPA